MGTYPTIKRPRQSSLVEPLLENYDTLTISTEATIRTNADPEPKSTTSSSFLVNTHHHPLEDKTDLDSHYRLRSEWKALWQLAAPTTVIQLGLSVAPFIIASYLGRQSIPNSIDDDSNNMRDNATYYLDGFTLSNLTLNLCTLSILQGLFTAFDTLAPQVYATAHEHPQQQQRHIRKDRSSLHYDDDEECGSSVVQDRRRRLPTNDQHKKDVSISDSTSIKQQVGSLAIRAYIASLLLMVPISIFLFWNLPVVMTWLGQPTVVVPYATEFYRLQVWTLPFYALFMIVWKFLSAQQPLPSHYNNDDDAEEEHSCDTPSHCVSLKPVMILSTLCCAGLLPFMVAVLGKLYGFRGAGYALIVFQMVQALGLVLYLYCRPSSYDPATWPGLSWAFQQVICLVYNPRPLWQFVCLGLGGILASSSWIYWETLTFLIGSTLGPKALSIHVIPTQVLCLAYMIPQGVGIALGIRLGSLLGTANNQRAKKLARQVYLVSLIVFGIMSCLLYVGRNAIFALFTTQDDVLKGVNAIWTTVCFYFFNTSMFGITMGIATALRMQWILGAITFFALWFVGLPCVYYFGISVEGQVGIVGLRAIWQCMPWPYLFINTIMAIAFVTTNNWRTDIVVDLQLEREETDEDAQVENVFMSESET